MAPLGWVPLMAPVALDDPSVRPIATLGADELRTCPSGVARWASWDDASRATFTSTSRRSIASRRRRPSAGTSARRVAERLADDFRQDAHRERQRSRRVRQLVFGLGHPAVVVFEADDVVLPEVRPVLDLDKYQFGFTTVFDTVGGPDRHVDRCSGCDVAYRPVNSHPSVSSDHKPVLGSLEVTLLAQALSGSDHYPLHFMAGPVLQHCIEPQGRASCWPTMATTLALRESASR